MIILATHDALLQIGFCGIFMILVNAILVIIDSGYYKSLYPFHGSPIIGLLLNYHLVYFILSTVAPVVYL